MVVIPLCLLFFMPIWRMSFAAAHLEVYADCSSNPGDAVHKSHLAMVLGISLQTNIAVARTRNLDLKIAWGPGAPDGVYERDVIHQWTISGTSFIH
jgi:hypothetical protein